VKTLVLSILAVVLIAVPSRADNCGQAVVVKKQAVVTQPYVATIVTPYVQTVAVTPVLAIPIYSAVYAPPDNSALIEKINTLTAKIESLESPRQVLTQEVKAPVAPVANLLAVKCALCHGVESDKKGGGFKMFDALNNNTLDEDHKLAAISHIAGGTMPKGKSLSTAERKQAIDLLR
jgi:mono/diheme cytochrome c family protein